MNVILFLWQLPQNILGLFVILLSGAKKSNDIYITPRNFGVSLGNYIILHPDPDYFSIGHEKGHQKQSKYLGWFYLLLIGLPSLIGNIYDRIAHSNWNVRKRFRWYYNQPWEKWANDISGLDVNEYLSF